ncbi:hypothetical protein FOCC_FOCC003139, partial [Frankliniella occidentalis]
MNAVEGRVTSRSASVCPLIRDFPKTPSQYRLEGLTYSYCQALSSVLALPTRASRAGGDICFRTLKLSTPTYGDLNHLVSLTVSWTRRVPWPPV